MYELTKIQTTELTIADKVAIKQATGYDLAIYEHKVLFNKLQAAAAWLMQHHDYMRIVKVSSIDELIKRDAILTVHNVRNVCGLAFIQSILVVAITDVCALLNVSKPMNAEQIAFTVDCIIETRPICNLSLADIKLALKYLAMGKYGKIYDRIDANTILDALNQYATERAAIAATYAERQHEQMKHQYNSKRAGEASIGKLLNLKK